LKPNSCYILITKPTRCTNFSNLFLEQNSTCFGQFLCPSSGVFHCTHSNGICHTGLLTACEQDQDGTSWSCSQAVWHIPLLCVQWKTAYDGQRNCPKHVEFCSKKKFENLVHLVGFIIRIYHDARSPEHQKKNSWYSASQVIQLKIHILGNSCYSNHNVQNTVQIHKVLLYNTTNFQHYILTYILHIIIVMYLLCMLPNSNNENKI